jgi:carbamoyl-phosphate synthase large subunit
MPKRSDLKSILIIGAGPIVIGQACEFDYSGTQACKALRAEGYRIILVNSNPATIMTDPNLADRTYIEPITPDVVASIIAIERPSAVLPTVGGQTALNCALALAKNGTLAKYNVELIGASVEAIKKAEDRALFQQAMDKIGLSTPKNCLVNSLEQAKNILPEIGLPAIIRPSFTMGGAGGGVAYSEDEYFKIIEYGLSLSPVGEVLIDQSIIGWKEFEMEVVRDKKDNAIIICSIENVDPMGVHTGDSITVAPALTLTDKEYQNMRNASLAVLREIGVETGGANVQFAVNPYNGQMTVIEMNPRVSRSSALASKATGFPIAKVAAKLAVGFTLDEIQNDITDGKTPASFEPTIDYVITKIPKFTFEKFKSSTNILSSSMKSVGEVMAIGRCFAESLHKALRSLEGNLSGLEEIVIDCEDADFRKQIIRKQLQIPSSNRLLVIAQAFREGLSLAEINQISSYDPWFLEQVQNIIVAEKNIARNGIPNNRDYLFNLKRQGFSDKRIAKLCNASEQEIRKLRYALDIHPVYKRVDSCSAEFDTATSYFYSTYE